MLYEVCIDFPFDNSRSAGDSPNFVNIPDFLA